MQVALPLPRLPARAADAASKAAADVASKAAADAATKAAAEAAEAAADRRAAALAALPPGDRAWLAAHPGVALFEELKVTTITLIMALEGTVHLHGAHRLFAIPTLALPEQKRRSKRFKLPRGAPPGTIISSRFGNDCRGVLRHAPEADDEAAARKKTYFKNTITIDIATSVKNISVKLSPITIQMCGASSREDGVEAAQHLLRHLARIQAFLDLKAAAPARVAATLKAVCEALQGEPRRNAQGQADFALRRTADLDAAFEASRHLGVDRELLGYLFALANDAAYCPDFVRYRYECLGEFVAGTLKYWFEGLDCVAESRTAPRRPAPAKGKRRPEALPEPEPPLPAFPPPVAPVFDGARFVGPGRRPPSPARSASRPSDSESAPSPSWATDSWLGSASDGAEAPAEGRQSLLDAITLGARLWEARPPADAISLGAQIWEALAAPPDLGPDLEPEGEPLAPARVRVVYVKNVMVNCNFELGFAVDREALKRHILGRAGFSARFDNSIEHNVAIERPYEQPPDPFFPPKKDKVPRITALVFHSGHVTISGDGSESMRETYYLLVRTIHELRPLVEYRE